MLDRAAGEIDLSRTSDFVNRLQAEIVYKVASSHRRHRWAETCGHIFASPWMRLESGSVEKIASKRQLLRGEVRSDVHVGSAAWAAPDG